MEGQQTIDTATLDDRLDALVTRFLDDYRGAPWADKEKSITKTQLAALVSTAESLGANGLKGQVDAHRKRDEKNAKANAERKGGKAPTNPTFWKLMKKYLEADLDELAEARGDRDGVWALFALRLAIEWSHRQACSDDGSKK